jgi:DNA excision repair protein ERCC-6-like 2
MSMPPRRNDTKPYNPPEPIVFSDIESENPAERPSFDTAPPAPKEDLLLASGGVLPAATAQWLRNYQVDGVEYMYRLWKEGKGGILGDDMGLGSLFPLCTVLTIETVQVIAFLTAVFGKRGHSDDKKRMRLARERNLPYPRVLIICPGSVMSNWERELQTVYQSEKEVNDSGDGGMSRYFMGPIK